MKARLLTLFSLLALLLVSTAILADGRPTGIRIGQAVSGGGGNVEIDVTMTDTLGPYDLFYATVWLGNNTFIFDTCCWQYASDDFIVPLPWAIDWGDGNYVGNAVLFGPDFGP